MERERYLQWKAATLTVSTLALLALAAIPARVLARDGSIEELKNRLAATSVQNSSALCIEISEKQLRAAAQLYAAGDDEKAQAALSDVTLFSGRARDYAIQSHRNLKKSEIAIRKMTRKLSDLAHIVAHEDQPGIQEAIGQLQAIRDDLLGAMFSGGKD
jgi:hypothetical protein